jgi:hypothetical protein
MITNKIHITLSHLYAYGHKTRNLIQQDMNLESLEVNNVLTKNVCQSVNKVLNSMMLFLGVQFYCHVNLVIT